MSTKPYALVKLYEINSEGGQQALFDRIKADVSGVPSVDAEKFASRVIATLLVGQNAEYATPSGQVKQHNYRCELNEHGHVLYKYAKTNRK